MYSSPGTPAGTGRKLVSSTSSDTPRSGAPIVTVSPVTNGALTFAMTVASVGP